MPRKYIILFAIMPAVIILDQVTKLMVLDKLSFGENIPLIEGFFDFTHVRNKGAAFSFLATADESFRRPFFILMPLAALGVVGYLFKKLPPSSKLLSTSLALIMGGAIGNLIDRVRLGSVVDFILVHYRYEWQYPAFNVADIAICIGVGLMVIDLFQNKNRAKTA